jgi:signal transduction histidine kinase
MLQFSTIDERVLLRTPVGADAQLTARVLADAGFATLICTSLDELAGDLRHGCGAVLLTEEAVIRNDVTRLREALEAQPKWSDVPIILLTSGGQTTAASTTAMNLLGTNCSLTLVERPLRTVTLVAALTSALRSRRRQYEVRQLITERDGLLASLEQRVQDRTAKLRQIVEELEAFSYSVSHDLRAPLRALEAYAEALVEETANLSPEARNYAEKIARSAQRMDHLTQDLLTYTRVSRDGVALDRIELGALLRDVVQTYPSILRWSPHIELREPLAAVLGHAPSLMQCFSNLLDNAFKFAAPGRVPCVVVSSECAGEIVRVSVADNGTGIEPQHHERIFGIFERATRNTEGTGIGLAIVRRAVERMGGRVGVISTPGAGATFWLELLRPPETPAPPPLVTANTSLPDGQLSWSAT